MWQMDRFKLNSPLFEAYVEAFLSKSKKLCLFARRELSVFPETLVSEAGNLDELEAEKNGSDYQFSPMICTVHQSIV